MWQSKTPAGGRGNSGVHLVDVVVVSVSVVVDAVDVVCDAGHAVDDAAGEVGVSVVAAIGVAGRVHPASAVAFHSGTDSTSARVFSSTCVVSVLSVTPFDFIAYRY